MAYNILETPELEHYISTFVVSDMEEIGTKNWFKKADRVLKLYQVAVLESKMGGGEERIKCELLEYNKVGILIYEMITIYVWKEKLLPELLLLSPKPNHSFPTYIIMYYEVLLVGLVQSVLFYSDVFDYIGVNSMDLVNYAVSQVTRLNPIEMQSEMKTEIDLLDEIKQHKALMDFNIGTSCIGILRYIVENFQKLPLDVVSSIYSVHDVPILAVCLIENNIWTKRKNGKCFKFFDNDWREWNESDPPLSPVECQVWLLLRQLLLDAACITNYNFTLYHKEQFLKLNKYLYTAVLDQLSPLVDLKHWLHQMSVTGVNSPTPSKPLIVEVTANFRDTLYSRYKKKWSRIAQERSQFLFYANPRELKEVADSLSVIFDKLDNVIDNSQTCSSCFAKADKRCSKCKKIWYCSRKCQVNHWKSHKSVCCA